MKKLIITLVIILVFGAPSVSAQEGGPVDFIREIINPATPTPTIEPTPTETPVSPTPEPTIEPTNAPTPTVEPTETPIPTPTNSPAPTPTIVIPTVPPVTVSPTDPVPSVTNKPITTTPTPEPTDTEEPTPTPTDTPEPTPVEEERNNRGILGFLFGPRNPTPTPSPSDPETTGTPTPTPEPTPKKIFAPFGLFGHDTDKNFYSGNPTSPQVVSLLIMIAVILFVSGIVVLNTKSLQSLHLQLKRIASNLF